MAQERILGLEERKLRLEIERLERPRYSLPSLSLGLVSFLLGLLAGWLLL